MDNCSAYQTDLATPNKRTMIVAGGVVALAAIVAILTLSNVSGAPPEYSGATEQAKAFTEPAGTTATTGDATHRAEVTAPNANFTQPVAMPPNGSPTHPPEASAPTASAAEPVEVPGTTAKFTERVEPPTSSGASSHPVEAPAVTQPVQSSKRASMSKKDIAQMQARLHRLGYLSVSPTGTFGAKTRAALLAFKSANGLPNNEVWDDETKIRLSSKTAVRTPPRVVNAIR